MDPPAPRFTRRRALRLVGSAALALALPALRGPRGADARLGWCRADPVVKIDGQTAHVYVSARVRNMREARALATGPTRVVVAVPPDVEAEYVAGNAGFGFGYEVVVEPSTDLAATATTLPVRVTV